MWLFMTIMNMLIPVTMILFGHYFSKKVPKNINYIYGYRTSMSMKNKDTWVFAHKHFGRSWHILGLILLPVSIIAMLFLIGKDTDTIGEIGSVIILGQCLFLILSIIPTEVALRKTFDKDGKRKHDV